jgi:hypothetical protein
MAEDDKKTIWAKIGGAVKEGAKATGKVLNLVPKALIYPIRKPFASLGEMKHDAKVALQEAVGMDVPEKEREYDPPIETTQASKNLGIEIISYKDEKIKFLASRTLVGDVSHLSPKQLGQIKEVLPNIDVFREENKVVIEVDVGKITNDIKNSPEHKGKSPEKIKGLIIKQIKQKVDGDLKKLAEITGGELKRHTDRKLLHGIAEKLYREYDSRSSETAVPSHKKQQLSETKPIEPANNKKSSEQLSETAVPNKSSSTMKSSGNVKPEEFNITNPMGFPFHNEMTFPAKSIQLLQDIKEQAEGLESAFNFKDVSPGEEIKQLSTSTVKRNKEGGRPI